MPKVRQGAGRRFAERAAVATPDYIAGAQNPSAPWQESTIAAAENHKVATTKALAEGRFAKGVAKSGQATYMKGVMGKGAERFAAGVAAGVGDYEKGVAPYTAAIQGIALPPRYPKGDPRNIARVSAIASKLHAVKNEQL